jgi:hypothetical protein
LRSHLPARQAVFFGKSGYLLINGGFAAVFSLNPVVFKMERGHAFQPFAMGRPV